MEPNVLPYILAGIGIVIGIIAGKIIFSKNTKRQVEEAEQRAKSESEKRVLEEEARKKAEESARFLPA